MFLNSSKNWLPTLIVRSERTSTDSPLRSNREFGLRHPGVSINFSNPTGGAYKECFPFSRAALPLLTSYEKLYIEHKPDIVANYWFYSASAKQYVRNNLLSLQHSRISQSYSMGRVRCISFFTTDILFAPLIDNHPSKRDGNAHLTERRSPKVRFSAAPCDKSPRASRRHRY